MNTGIRTRVSTVSCHDSSTMAMKAAVTVTEFCRMDVAVSVSTVRTPATSLASLDWMAPVLVAVKNASSIFCRCANSSLRRSAMAELPTVDVSQFCPIAMSEATIGMTHMPTTSQPSRPRSGGPVFGNRASSKTALVRNGTIDVRVAAVMTAMATSASLARYGRSSFAMRPSTG